MKQRDKSVTEGASVMSIFPAVSDRCDDGGHSVADSVAEMPKCFMLAPEFPPKNTAGVHRTLRFCQFLPDLGWTPVVLTSNVSEPGGDKLMHKIPSSTVVTRVGPVVHVAAGNGEASAMTASRAGAYSALRRLLSPAMQLATETPDRNVRWSRLAQKQGAEYLRQHAVDVLYSSGPPHSVHLAARKLACQFAIPWVADFRDPWARKPWTKKANPWGQRLLPLLERAVIRDATKVILNTQASYEDFSSAYPQYRQKFHCIPNGLDPDLLRSVRELSNVSRGVNEVPILCHPGGLYGHRDPAPVLRAIARLAVEGLPIKLQQIGMVAEAFRPQQLAHELGIGHLFEHIASLSHRETLAEMVRADLLLIVQPDAPLMVPSKAYEMLAFDQPLVAVCDGAGTEAVMRDAGGYIAPSRDEVQIARVLRQAWLGRSDLERRSLREKARAKYDGRRLTQDLAEIFAQAAQCRPSPHTYRAQVDRVGV